jgi:N-acetylmuramoyl-L-alanine amidase
MPKGSDTLGASQSFDAVRRRGIRTLSFHALGNHPDFVRLSIADGHLPGLYVTPDTNWNSADVSSAVDDWEALLARIMGGLPTPKLVLIQDPALVPALEGRGYTVIQAQSHSDVRAGQVVQLTVDRGGAQGLANLAYVAAQQGLGLGPHEIAEAENAKPFQHPPRATTLAEFQERYLVILDPGHSRADNGTPIYPPIGRPVLERWAVLERTYAWEALLQNSGWTHVRTHDDDSLFDEYTRTPDTVDDRQNTRRDDLQYRANLSAYLGIRSRRTPILVSMHIDSHTNPSIVGPLTFYPAHGDTVLIAQSKQLAEEMHNALVAFWTDLSIDAPGRGVLHADTYAWDRMAEAGYTTIGNRFTLPAPGAGRLPTDVCIAVLIEAGVATHPEEAQILATAEGNIALAQAHHAAFTRWVNWMIEQP